MLKSNNGSVKLMTKVLFMSNQQFEVISWMKQVSALIMTVYSFMTSTGLLVYDAASCLFS